LATQIIRGAVNKVQRIGGGKSPRVNFIFGASSMRTESIIFGFIALTSALILSGLFLMVPSP
jgi:hypothetical protein